MRPVRPNPSAHSGLTEWLLQRATAVCLAAFLLYIVTRLVLDPPADHSTWRAWFGQGGVRIVWALGFAAVLIHAWIGLRSVFIDYLGSLALRLLAYLLTALALLALALWCAQLLLSVGGGT